MRNRNIFYTLCICFIFMGGCTSFIQQVNKIHNGLGDYNKTESVDEDRDDSYIAKSSKSGRYAIFVRDYYYKFPKEVTSIKVYKQFRYNKMNYVILRIQKGSATEYQLFTLPKKSSDFGSFALKNASNNSFVTFETSEGMAIMQETDIHGKFLAWNLKKNAELQGPYYISSKKHRQSRPSTGTAARPRRESATAHSRTPSPKRTQPEREQTGRQEKAVHREDDIAFEFSSQKPKSAPQKMEKLTLILDD